MIRRSWIKIYVDQCLRGTMMDEMEDPAERFVWFGFLLLAGDSAFDGKIAITNDMGYTNEQLGALLKCDVNVIKSAKRKMLKYDKISLLNNDVVQVSNWQKYQSEYQRQKLYRDKDELQDEVTPESYNDKLLLDRDKREIRKEREEDKEEEKRELTSTERQILGLLKRVKNYPYDYLDTLSYLRELSIEFPRLDLLEQVKKKVAWWRDKPLTKKSNPHLQLRNWFIKATEFQGERHRENQVGQSAAPPKTQDDKDADKAYLQARDKRTDELKRKYKWDAAVKRAMKSQDRSELEDIEETIREELAIWHEENQPKPNGVVRCHACKSHVENAVTCGNCGELL